MSKSVKITLGIIGGLFVIGLLAPKEEQATVAAPKEAEKLVETANSQKESPVLTDDEIFLTFARDTYPVELSQVPDDTLVSTARATCDALDAGLTMTDILVMAAESAISNDLSDSYTEAMGGVIGFGVGVYCPEYSN